MGRFSARASSGYPGIPTITQDPAVQLDALGAIKEALEIHERRTANSVDSFVRVQDLIDLELIEKQGNHYYVRSPTVTGSKAANAALESLIDGLVALGLIIDETT